MDYFFDSNIFVNAKINDRKYGPSCSSAITDLAGGRLSGATSTVVLVEVSSALRKIGLSRGVGLELNAIYSTGIEVSELLNADVRLMADLFRVSGVSSADCAHAAIMKRLGLVKILSTDPHFEKIPGIGRLDPLNYNPR